MKEQIEEIARIICADSANKGLCEKCGFNKGCWKFKDAEAIYNAGYRKQVGNANFATTTGKWEKRVFIIFDSEKVGYRCSECNTTWETPTNYCPNCGAKMKGGE